MKSFYLLDVGDIIKDDDETYVGQHWIGSNFVGKPVVNGLFRRASEPEESTETSDNTGHDAIALCKKLEKWMMEQDGSCEVQLGLALLLKEAQGIAQQHHG